MKDDNYEKFMFELGKITGLITSLQKEQEKLTDDIKDMQSEINDISNEIKNRNKVIKTLGLVLIVVTSFIATVIGGILNIKND